MNEHRSQEKELIELEEVRRIAKVSYLAGWMRACELGLNKDTALRSYEAFEAQLEKTVLDRKR